MWVIVNWKNGVPEKVKVETPCEISPSRAEAIFHAEQGKRFPWNHGGLPGDMTPEEMAWLRNYWKTLPGDYSLYDALCRLINST
jgi:hypothetical protein